MSKKAYKFEILEKDKYHFYYEDRDDNAGGAIVYKNLKNNEFFEQSGKIRSLKDFYDTCENFIKNFWHLLPFGKNENNKNQLVMITDIKALQADLNNSTSLDEFKLEAEHQAAAAIVEANMAQFEAEMQEIKEKEQAEREVLIAEASRLTGRVEALNFIKKVADTASLVTIKNIKESGVYKELPNIKTWEEYCKSIGISRRYLDEQLESLSTFGEDFLAVSATFGVGYKELRQLKKEVKTGNLEVKEESVIIDGEIIPLNDKDELRDALDTLLKSKYKEIEEKDKRIQDQHESIEIKNNEIMRLKESNKNFFEDKQKAEKALADLKGVGTLHGIPLDENADFQKIADIEREIEVMYNHLCVTLKREYKEKQEDNTYKVIKLDELSEFNKKKLGAVVIKAMNLLHDFHQELCSMGVCDYYGEAFMPDEVLDAAGRLETPADYLRNHKE